VARPSAEVFDETGALNVYGLCKRGAAQCKIFGKIFKNNIAADPHIDWRLKFVAKGSLVAAKLRFIDFALGIIIKNRFLQFLSEEDGLTTVEYAIAGGLVSAVIVLAFVELGAAVGNVITGVTGLISP
jgi:pilus assembly protein Flp/PilA